MGSSQLLKAIAVTAQIYGRELSEDAARVYAADLAAYPEALVLQALSRCRKEVPRFPTIADIVARIDDGRPGADEAWAMIPKDERASVVWSAEMRDAFGVARALIDSDEIAARMAFRETYTRLVSDARARGVPAQWEPSLGHDRLGHAAALKEAVHKGRITAAHANALLAEPARSEVRQLEGPADEPTADPLANIASILRAIAPRKDAS
jgi:hypothetical protein